MEAAKSDVFLSHNGSDKAVVEEIAFRLHAHGIIPWLDIWNLVPGEPWQEAIEQALNNCATCAVFIGPSGAGPWQNEEMRTAINRRVTSNDGSFRVIPVFLPGVKRTEVHSLPDFLQRQTWVEFHHSLDDEADFHRLLSGIQGKAPGAQLNQVVFNGDCPYRGLQVFDVQDDRFFFGRDTLKSWMLNKIIPSTGSRQDLRFLGVLGPSGSGKSSLTRAGLLAALKRDEITGSSKWPIVICRPGADPVESLAVAIADIAGYINPLQIRDFIDSVYKDERALHLTIRWILRQSQPETRIVILIDQFEEVFTVCHSDNFRQAFFDNLFYVAGVVGGQGIVLVTMRTDFYGRCAAYQSLAAALSNHQLLVGTMTKGEMKSAIENPAKLTGYEFEVGLVDVLLEDAANEPGALPLLQHALLELWEKRKGRMLTHEAYDAIGRLEGALDRRAEKIYDKFESDEKILCRRILLRLIQVGQGTEATKRRVPFRELLSTDWEYAQIEAIITKLAAPDARLITTHAEGGSYGEPVVELSHEALIKSWGRLRDWIEESRQNLLTQHRLIEAVNEWRSNNKNESFLYRGARLTHAVEWAQANPDELNNDESEFIQESIDQAAEDSLSSDAAALDQLEASAKLIWMDIVEMNNWLERCYKLIESLENHNRQLDRYRREAQCKLNDLSFPIWVFTDKERQFQHDTLAMLIHRIEQFRDGIVAAAEHVVKVTPELGKLTIEACQGAWQQAIASISNEHECIYYKGLVIKPQIGLIPIGQDPVSGLWEFCHIQTGSVPFRDTDSKLVLTDKTGVILILLPKATFAMGATKPTDAYPVGLPNVDPYALDEEMPIHPVTLDPFFIAKYQMTQGQWLRASGYNPSMFKPNNSESATLMHPVECVSWYECEKILYPLNLLLPTEAQWEYAARSGTGTIWWVGNDEKLLIGAANLEQTTHTPVGLFNSPNQFGLHDVAGNVWEWCKDWYGPYTNPVASGNAERQVSTVKHKVSRGGSFFNIASFARSSIRYFHTLPDARFNNRGFRAARALACELT